jgi:hypothetical protein
MEFNTSSSGKKRKMIFVPDVNPRTFLMFFERGTSGYSYSLRDFSVRNRVSERYAKEFQWSADELCRRATYMFDAPTMDTNNLDFWHTYTTQGNKQFLPQVGVLRTTLVHEADRHDRANDSTAYRTNAERFPILDMEAFQSLPKFMKTVDVERMLTSSQSEDWVTWNLLRLIQRSGGFWTNLLRDARFANDRRLELSKLESTETTFSFWRTVESPKAYEAASRRRMLQSGDPQLVARASDSRPVEGKSEIDVVIEAPGLVVFAEAKLGSDISMQTTCDPARNQIARNIDCLIEEAHGRTPLFWMFVRDLAPSRAYVQLMREYRDNPRTLARDLPHRDPVQLQGIARSLVMLTWRDLGMHVCVPRLDDSEALRALKQELVRRIS